MKKISLLLTVSGLTLILSGCGQTQVPNEAQNNNVALANPASANCEKLGGTVTIKTRGDLGQYGVCMFEDNRQCEEWALFRGECPQGGLKITGYENEAQIFCAITGATVDMAEKVCTKNGVACDFDKYFLGECDFQ